MAAHVDDNIIVRATIICGYRLWIFEIMHLAGTHFSEFNMGTTFNENWAHW